MKHWTVELAEYVFSDFWRWLGFVVLVRAAATRVVVQRPPRFSFEG